MYMDFYHHLTSHVYHTYVICIYMIYVYDKINKKENDKHKVQYEVDFEVVRGNGMGAKYRQKYILEIVYSVLGSWVIISA